LCIAAYFGAEKDKDREALRRDYRAKLDAWKAGGDRLEIDGIVEELRGGERPVLPLHWEIEFPEVFGRGNPGFDAMVGNPPFAGPVTLTAANRPHFSDWLRFNHAGTGGKCDLVAYFFRRTFDLLRGWGSFGLVATNTIAQGDTRTSGLSAILNQGGHIYAATRRVRWPGMAAVVVSVVHVLRGFPRSFLLDGREVPQITPFLYGKGALQEPVRLHKNSRVAFLGCKPGSKGFVFEDGDPSANSLSELEQLMKDAAETGAVRPYLGGAELNDSPTLSPRRWIVYFGNLDETAARMYPGAFALVERKVKPVVQGTRWWQYASSASDFYSRCPAFQRVLVTAEVSNSFAFAFMAPNIVFSNKLVLFLLDRWHDFCLLQSRVHESWVRLLSSTMKDDLSYVPADAFQTFPCALGADCETAGQTYYDFRAALMVRNDQGLTKTYNRFHSPNECDPDIFKLRELHSAMDRAVLDAYGWSDIATDCDFLLDYEIDEATWGDKKKPFRYRWPDAVRDEVLARLLDLNQRRHQEEVVAGLHGKVDKVAPVVAKKPRGPRKARAAKGEASQGTLSLAAAPDPHPPAPSPEGEGEEIER
ncbi:MAG: DNA methyltransferase, partial [Myxococcales bacterium]